MDYVRLLAFNPGPYTGDGNNTYLIKGREPALVDAGIGDPRHLNGIDRAPGGSSLVRVIVTHGHRDHISGVEAIAARWPGTRFCKLPWPEHDGRYDVSWEALGAGNLVRAGDTQLWVVHTPGHAPDHICLLSETIGELFSGDLVVSGGTVVIPRARAATSWRTWTRSRRCVRLDHAAFYPRTVPLSRIRGLSWTSTSGTGTNANTKCSQLSQMVRAASRASLLTCIPACARISPALRWRACSRTSSSSNKTGWPCVGEANGVWSRHANL